jgi:hypothetical protein
MCRIWIDSVPPDRQPEPTDCPTALRRRPPNARVVFGDDVQKRPEAVKSLRGDDRRDDRREKKPKEEPERGKRKLPPGLLRRN